MSKYTTGEIAKLCGVSVRTVQYYDSRNILVPSELSEGGRRLYSEDDLKRMRIICFLREAGLPINSIGELFDEEHPENVISILLNQQEKELREEIAEGQKKLSIIETIKSQLKEIENFSVESIGDIAHIMKKKNEMKKLRAIMLITGIPVIALQWISIILWTTKGIGSLRHGRLLQWFMPFGYRFTTTKVLPISVPNATMYSSRVSRKCFGHTTRPKCVV